MIKLSRSLFTCLALLVTATGVFAAATGKSASTKPRPAAPVPTPTPPPAPAPVTLKLEDYINDLATTLKLSDADKKSVEDIYVADGDPMKEVLNNDALSPLQQAQQVSDLRDARNAKIEALLTDVDRQQAFLTIEARYRVALTELAANGGWVAPPPPPAAAPSTNAPAGNPPSTNAAPAAKAP